MPTRTTAKSSTKPVKKKPTAKPRQPAATEQTLQPRRLRLPAYKPFRLKRIKYPEKLPSVWRLSAQTVKLLWSRKVLFLGIALVFIVLSLLLVPGVVSTNVANLKQQLGASNSGNSGQVVTGVSIFSNLLSSSTNNSNNGAAVWQLFIVLVVSLATIWAVRQTMAGQRIRIRDPFYKGMYPLVPFVLVIVVVLLQTLPFLLGGLIFSAVVNYGVAIYAQEQFLWGLLFATLTLVSVYMLCSSLFAVYIVTLPDMTPMKALRSARQLVRYRRLQVFRKLFFLPLALAAVALIIMFPVILLLTTIASWVFFVLLSLLLIIAHAYMYTLYKALLA